MNLFPNDTRRLKLGGAQPSATLCSVTLCANPSGELACMSTTSSLVVHVEDQSYLRNADRSFAFEVAPSLATTHVMGTRKFSGLGAGG